MKQVEELAGLRDRAEQRVVAAGALALPVVADGTALGMASGAQHRAIEVDRDSRELLLAKTLDHEVTVQRTSAINVAHRHFGKAARPGRDRSALRIVHGARSHEYGR